MLEQLPNEIIFGILEFVPDFVSLQNFLHASPHLGQLFPGNFKNVFISILDQIESQQLRNLIKTVLAVRHNIKTQYSWDLRDTHEAPILGYPMMKEDRLCLEDMQDPLSALRDIAHTYRDLKHFERSFVTSCFTRRGLAGIEQRALSPVEDHRIRRALWRFQLLFEICDMRTQVRSANFHCSPSESDGNPNRYNAPNYWRYRQGLPRAEANILQRKSDIMDHFLSIMNTWEFEEMQCLASHMCSAYQTLKTKRAHVPVHSQKPILQRLLKTVGFDPHELSPGNLDDCPEGICTRDNLFHQAFYICGEGLISRGTQPSDCDVPGADGPTKGWDCFTTYNYHGVEIARWTEYNAFRLEPRVLQTWGYCIWDDERLHDWGWFDPNHEDRPNWPVWELQLMQKPFEVDT
ncbi:MAG: hypothetical protein Q9208_003839 [Pyrenodesmia sp. 3 TL-2023]